MKIKRPDEHEANLEARPERRVRVKAMKAAGQNDVAARMRVKQVKCDAGEVSCGQPVRRLRWVGLKNDVKKIAAERAVPKQKNECQRPADEAMNGGPKRSKHCPRQLWWRWFVESNIVTQLLVSIPNILYDQ